MDSENKPTLSDVMNAIITSVSRGRQTADFEAMRSALVYQKIDLLKGLPVPRMRINNIKISIPMILNAVTPYTAPEHATIAQMVIFATESFIREINSSIEWMKAGLDLLDIDESRKNLQIKSIKTFNDIFQQVANKHNLYYKSFSNDLKQRLIFELGIYKSSVSGITSEEGIKDVVGSCVEKSMLLIIKNSIYKWIKERVSQKEGVEFDVDRANRRIDEYCDDKIILGIIKRVKFNTESICIVKNEKKSELEVLVDTESIKNAGGGPDTVTHLSFVLREEGLEWITEVNEDKTIKTSLSTE